MMMQRSLTPGNAAQSTSTSVDLVDAAKRRFSAKELRARNPVYRARDGSTVTVSSPSIIVSLLKMAAEPTVRVIVPDGPRW